jgi:hypothetical protein
VSTEARLSHPEIRRALAECTGPHHLPFADAELGGVPIWFRSTIEAWQATLPEPDLDADEEEDEADDEPEAEPEAEPEEPDEEPDLRSVHSGFDLATGQRVTANIRGRWREAVVTHRDRATVAVDYNIDDTPHGLRRQRVSVDRIRLRDAD